MDNRLLKLHTDRLQNILISFNITRGYISISIDMEKNACLSVRYMHFHAVQSDAAKFTRNIPLTKRKIDVYSYHKEFSSSPKKYWGFQSDQSECSITYCTGER